MVALRAGRGCGAWCGGVAAWRRCVGAGSVAWLRASAVKRAPFPAAAKSLTTKALLERESANFADSLSSIPLTHSNLAAAHSITIHHNHTPATHQQYTRNTQQHITTTQLQRTNNTPATTPTHQPHPGNNTNTPTTPRDHTKPRALNPLTHSHFLKTNRPISPICFQHLTDTQSLSRPTTKSEYVKICPATRTD